jgi:hypothetical protein
MPKPSPERLIELNQQALALLRLGIPLDLGLGTDPETALRELNERLVGELRSDLSLDQALEKHRAPPAYRPIARMLTAASDPLPVFKALVARQANLQAAAGPLRRAAIEPLLVACLAYVGMIVFCGTMVPGIADQYAQLGQPPEDVAWLLIRIRELMPVWLVGFPVLVLAGWLGWRRFARRLPATVLPGAARYQHWLRAEAQTRYLAALATSDLDPDQAAALAREGANADRRGTRATAAPLPLANRLLREVDRQSRPAALERLAAFYRGLTDEERGSRFGRVPATVGVLIAGVIVLAYGLALFLPWVQLLDMLCRWGSGR